MAKLTKARRAALLYVQETQPVKLFPLTGPSLRIIRQMTKDGLLSATPSTTGFGFIAYSLTDAGRAALPAATRGEE